MSVTLYATQDYKETGNYIARILGRKLNVKFERDFIGKVSAEVVEPGVFEIRHATRKGKYTEYCAVIELDGKLVRMKCGEGDALLIAKNLDAGYDFEHTYRVYAGDRAWIEAVKLGEAKKAKTAANVEEAITTCKVILSKLTFGERRKVLQALRKNEETAEAQPT